MTKASKANGKHKPTDAEKLVKAAHDTLLPPKVAKKKAVKAKVSTPSKAKPTKAKPKTPKKKDTKKEKVLKSNARTHAKIDTPKPIVVKGAPADGIEPRYTVNYKSNITNDWSDFEYFNTLKGAHTKFNRLRKDHDPKDIVCLTAIDTHGTVVAFGTGGVQNLPQCETSEEWKHKQLAVVEGEGMVPPLLVKTTQPNGNSEHTTT